jgi:hypothetical protein
MLFLLMFLLISIGGDFAIKKCQNQMLAGNEHALQTRACQRIIDCWKFGFTVHKLAEASLIAGFERARVTNARLPGSRTLAGKK